MVGKADITGRVASISNHGTIVQMLVRTRGRRRPFVFVNFDHRMFWHLWEAREENVIGRKVRVSGREFENQSVSFLD